MKFPISPGHTIRLPLSVHSTERVCESEAILDTEASFVTIPRRVARFLGYDIRDVPRANINTANGVVRAPLIALAKAILGNIEIAAVPAICLDIGAGGVISLFRMSFLGHFRVLLDPTRRLLSITEP